ncbi:MAG: CPBP family intramembrane glutamic endopeptidase [Verrucomicrobiota bacterium]|jgi:membrane protease YdiL (CAAX protease family)
MRGEADLVLEALSGGGLLAVNVMFLAYLGVTLWVFHRLFLSKGRRRFTNLRPVGWDIWLPILVFSAFILLSLLPAAPAFSGQLEENPVPFLLLAGLAQILACAIGWWCASKVEMEPVALVLGLEIMRIPMGLIWAGIGLLLCVAPYLLASGVAYGLSNVLGLPVEEQPLVDLFRRNLDNPAWPVFFLTAAVIAPVAEEIMFRGFLYRALVNWTGHRWLPIGVSGLIFSLFHFHFLALLPLWVVGAVAAAVYERSGNLWAAIFFHAGFNTVQVLVMMYL